MRLRSARERIGHFEVLDLLDTQPAGAVYRVVDPNVGAEVALLVVGAQLVPDAGSRDALVRGLLRSRSLQHPNVMKVYDAREEADEILVSLQWPAGEKLSQRIALAPLPVKAARPILRQIASGLAHAHQLAIAFGDVYADTVMVHEDLVKLTSIGIAPHLPRQRLLEAMRTTPLYSRVAPEIRSGMAIDARSDVYGFAALAAELLTGRLVGEPLDLTGVPPALEPNLRRALAIDPLLRHSSVDMLAQEIDDALASGRSPKAAPVAHMGEETNPVVRQTEITLDFTRSDEDDLEQNTDQIDRVSEEVTREVSVEKLVSLRAESAGTQQIELEMIASSSDEEEPDPLRLEPEGHTNPVLRVSARSEDMRDEQMTTNPVPKQPAGPLFAPPPVVIAAPAPPPPSRPVAAPVVPFAAPAPAGSAAPPRSGRPAPPSPPRPPAPRTVPPPPRPQQVSHAPAPPAALAPEPQPVQIQPPGPMPNVAGLVALVLITMSVATAMALGVLHYMRELKHTQERQAKQQLADALRAKADALRLAPAPVAAAPLVLPAAAAPAAAAPPVAPRAVPSAQPAPRPLIPVTSSPCPLGASLLDSGKHSFCVDVYEYPGGKTIPRTGISFAEAARLCAMKKARLCTDLEWERACRGRGGVSYPYGDHYDPARCNTRGGPIAAAGSFKSCRSGSGAYDMSGNVAEWVTMGASGSPAQKGGSAHSPSVVARCSNTIKNISAGATPLVGFRCCSEVQ